ncbi:MAG: hypothetical protein GY856_55075 [bacterium]|nr:hypothetical protein [bacterium]
MKAQHRKWLIRALVALLVVEGSYLALGNYLLTGEFLRQKINRRPEKLEIAWTRAWTPFPGVVRVRDLTVRGQDRKLRWEIEIDRGWVSIALVSLARRKFHTHWLYGSGCRLRLRQRQPPSTEPAAPASRGRRPWTIELDAVAIEAIEEIGWDELQLVGEGRLGGAIYRVARGPLRIDSARVAMSAAELLVDSEPIARKLELESELSLASFVPGEQRGFPRRGTNGGFPRRGTNGGLQVLRFLSGTIRIEGEVSTIDILNQYFKNTPWLELHGGGRIAGTIEMERGELVEGTRIRIDSPHLGASVLDWEAHGSAALDGVVEGRGEEATSTLRVELRDLEISEPAERGTAIRAASFQIVTTVADMDVLDGFIDPAVTIDLPAAEVPDLGIFRGYFPPEIGLSTLSGNGRLRVRLNVEEGIGSGEIEVAGRRIGVDVDELRVVGDLDLHCRLANGDLATRSFEVTDARLEMENITLPEAKDDPINGWWARVDVAGGSVALTQPLAATGRVGVEMRDSRPILALFLEEKKRLQWLEKVLVIRDLRGEAEVQFSRSAVTLDHLTVRSRKDLEILARLRFSEAPAEGILYARYGRLSTGVELRDGKRNWKLTGARKWFEKHPGSRKQKAPE